MDQYPDEDEEFELRYQEELEMVDDFMTEEDQVNIVPSKLPNKAMASTPGLGVLQSGSETLQSPALSQISYDHNNSIEVGLGGHVNRRLFGTPKGPQRISSTPLPQKKRMAPIQEVIDLAPEVSEEGDAAVELQGMYLRNKRRLEQDLFGNIDDLYCNDTYEDPLAKKARTEEERDMAAIEKILETRQRLRESTKSMRKETLSQLQALHAFKMQNLSYSVPQWPFLPVHRSDQQSVYVRFHSNEYERRAIENVRAVPNFGGLLGESKHQVWEGANEIVLRRTNLTLAQPQAVVVPMRSTEDRLWVEKYKPRKYIELLSDETANRSLLFWLKMWDKVVFGKEFKKHFDGVGNKELNSFNKRTGRFESNGGWQNRKKRQNQLNTNVDDLGRPTQKVALLCGPPGLGKTTLAHTIAKHAGYAIREINASDDRSPEAFKLALENGTQMSAVLNEDRRPNCIVLDEIDGAPRQSIEFLIKFVSDSVKSKVHAKGTQKPQHNILKRPIICICNDVYIPALRPLRQIAFVINAPPIDSARLAERLEQVARNERLKTDFGSLLTLAEKSGNDVRSCISTMQFYNAQKKALTLHDVLNNNMGQKDRHQGLFDVWNAIFRIQRPKKQLESEAAFGGAEAQVTMTDMSISTRARNVLDVVHSGGDYERLMDGVHENYLQQKMPDPYLNGVVEATQWFCFTDMLNRQINQQQNYSIYPYLQFGFVVWHLLFASLGWPKISFPMRGIEFHKKSVTQRNIFNCFRKGITAGSVGLGQGSVTLVEAVPMLKRIISPQLRSLAVQLLSPKEQYDLKHTVAVMVDLGITYTQIKSADGTYIFQFEPDLDALAQFPDFVGVSLPYFGRQLIAREVQIERIRRATPRTSEEQRRKPQQPQQPKVPNHLQRLQPKKINATAKATKEVASKDFFGRIQCKTPSAQIEEGIADPIVKSPIWYRFKEGFNNAVRKDIHTNELL